MNYKFDAEYYLNRYNDLSVLGYTKDNIIEHWNKYGKKEERFCSLNHQLSLDINKISIVMAYYNRKNQTLETLKGFQKMYAGKYNFEVVIVDDNSNDESKLEEDIKQFTFPINLIVISAEEKEIE